VYYNPFYFYPSYWYPTRYYRGTNVVYVRPGLGGRQFVFRTRGDRAAPFVVYRDRRGGGMQQQPDRGARGVDFGGVGNVPAPGGRRTVGGGNDQAPSGRRMVGGGAEPAVGGSAFQRQPGAGSPQETGRRSAVPEPVTNPRVIGPSVATPSREDIGPMQPRQRGVYIDPGKRQTGSPSPAAVGRPEQRDNQRYIDPGTRQTNAPPPAAAGRPDPRENQRYIPQSAPRQESRGTPGYGVPEAPRSAPAGAPREAPRPAFAPRGGGPSSSPPAARAAPRAAPAPRSAPALVRRRG
jgi:hypothetical protein